MRDIFIVMKFTIKEMVIKKSFIISTLIILALIVIGFNIPNILKNLNKDSSGSDKVIITDNQGVFEGNLNALTEINKDYDFEIGNYDFEQIKEMLSDDKYDSAIMIEKDEEKIKLKYIVENIVLNNSVPEGIINSINALYTNMQIAKMGITPEQIAALNPNFEFDVVQTKDEKAEGNVFAMMAMSILLYYAIYFCAYQVSGSIVTEKTSKVMETLVSSTSPKTIIYGKTLGIGLVGMLQLILVATTALVSAKMFLEEEILNSVLDMSNITLLLGIVSILYFILGYATYAFLYALTGSTVSKPEDIQSANGPVAVLSVAGFYLSYFTMMNPTSNLNIFASIFPLSSPFCMPFRMMMGLAKTSDVLISILVLIITIVLIAKIAIKIYAGAILNYGTKMTIKDMFKIYKDKNV